MQEDRLNQLASFTRGSLSERKETEESVFFYGLNQPMATNTTSDHDLLIRVDVKLDNLAKKVDAIQDGVTRQIADHELRLRGIEAIVESTNPENTYKEFVTLKQDVRDFKTAARVYRIVAGAIGGAVFYIISQLPGWIKLLWGGN